MEKRLKTRAAVWGVILAIIVVVSALLPSFFSIQPVGIQNYFDVRIFNETSNTWIESLLGTNINTSVQIPSILLQTVVFGLFIIASFAKPINRRPAAGRILFALPGFIFLVCSVFQMSRAVINFRDVEISTNSLPQLFYLILYACMFLGLSILCFSIRTNLSKKAGRGIGVLSAIAVIVGFLLDTGEQIVTLGAQAIANSGYWAVFELIFEEAFIMAEALVALRMLMIVNARYLMAQRKSAADAIGINDGSDVAVSPAHSYQHIQQISQPPYAPPEAAVYEHAAIATQPNGNGRVQVITEEQLIFCKICGGRFRKQLAFCPKCGSAVMMSREASSSASASTEGYVPPPPPSSSSSPSAPAPAEGYVPPPSSLTPSAGARSYAIAGDGPETVQAVSGQPEFVNAAGPTIYNNEATLSNPHEGVNPDGLHSALTSTAFHESTAIAQPGFVAAAGPVFSLDVSSAPSPSQAATQPASPSAQSGNLDFGSVSEP